MLNEDFERELREGLTSNIYFLFSKEGFLLEHALKRILDAIIPPHQRDFNFDVFYPPSSPEEIFDAAYTLPFLAPRRLVVLKDFHLYSGSDIQALIPYFKNPCNTTCMIILSLKEPSLDTDVNWVVYSLDINEERLPLWLKQFAHEKGIELSDEAIEYLIETVGPEIGLLVMEVEKLALSGQRKIEIKDVIPSIGTTREYVPFNLVDALISGQKIKAFKILKTLTERPSNATAILGALNWHYRQFYALWQNKGRRPKKMRSSTFETLSRYLPYYKEEDFQEIFKSLHEADIGIKSFSRPEIALELLLIKLLQIGAVS
jgi:DNA polymerase-3 subunit delta